VPLSRLAKFFPGWAMVRAMPNTPATVGAGITALAPGDGITPEQLDQAKTIFGSVGEVIAVPEALIDAVTALSGSGPGYVALIIEALADGGVAVGLPRATAMQLALQTVKGTAELLQQTDLHPGVLKDRVTSPGGTTIAGVAHLEAAGLRSALIEAVRTAHDRAIELGQL
jgi:pyrroline-5-carboxylate reductase